MPDCRVSDLYLMVSPRILEELYIKWKYDPDSVDSEWNLFFAGFDLGCTTVRSASPESGNELQHIQKTQTILSLIQAYRTDGHLLACVDPLSPCQLDHPLLSPARFGILPDELESGFMVHDTGSSTLREILSMLKETYCHEIGVEFMHMPDGEERQWLIERMERSRNKTDFSESERLWLFEKLHLAVCFESFLQKKFPTQKRFSLEGAETIIPMLDSIVLAAPDSGIRDIVLGMAHRGRLNVLAHVLEKPSENIFAEFRGDDSVGFDGDGDVKYHKGYSTDRHVPGGSVHVSLAANPSHLEAVNPVVEGKCRARQELRGYPDRSCVLPVLIHGDGAFAGQGSVMELLNLSRLEGYETGGTIHLVLNNQIGFTTMPHDARSTRYATDAARMLSCPVFHIQGEAPEAALHTIRLALAYRQRFGRDIVLELVCFRRHGHNEADEPAFTQPLMYRQIASRSSVDRLYADELLNAGISPERLDSIRGRVMTRLDKAFQAGQQVHSIGFRDIWSSITRTYDTADCYTGISREALVMLSRTTAGLPDGFVPHAKIRSLLQKRHETVVQDTGIDWGNAECLAYASLAAEGVQVRLSGQDSRRGTFSHRHAVVYDSRTGAPWVPIQQAGQDGGGFQVWDSPLSEYGVLGFEYGYSLESPHGLVIWEAQFGDFANGAQVIIDQFITSGEAKWNRASGLVMFLPHGYEGQGAEHSSARIERFLQLCAENNIVVACPSTPAQMFHLLRRQVKRAFRKPLIVFTPKSLLRHPACVSTVDDLCTGAFQDIMPDITNDGQVARVLFCSGKVYYELLAEREARGSMDTAIIRIEQLYPLRTDLLKRELARYPRAEQVLWVQEEPENMGAWQYIRPHLMECCGSVRYAGRAADASPATGVHRLHVEQQKKLLEDAFGF